MSEILNSIRFNVVFSLKFLIIASIIIKSVENLKDFDKDFYISMLLHILIIIFVVFIFKIMILHYKFIRNYSNYQEEYIEDVVEENTYYPIEYNDYYTIPSKKTCFIHY